MRGHVLLRFGRKVREGGGDDGGEDADAEQEAKLETGGAEVIGAEVVLAQGGQQHQRDQVWQQRARLPC